jgi:hypothetical protein
MLASLLLLGLFWSTDIFGSFSVPGVTAAAGIASVAGIPALAGVTNQTYTVLWDIFYQNIE